MLDTTVPRRAALRTGGLAAVMAGLLGTPTTVAAEPAPTIDLVSVLCAEETPQADTQFVEWLTEWRAESALASRQHAAIVAQIEAYVPAERRFELVGKLSDISSDRAVLESSLHRELAFRHLPGLAPVLRLVWMHALTTKLDELDACGYGFCKDGDSGPY